MITFNKKTHLFAYGRGAQSLTIEEITWPVLDPVRRFVVYDIHQSLENAHITHKIDLDPSQQSAVVTLVETGESVSLLCANNRSAEELFGESILPAADAFFRHSAK